MTNKKEVHRALRHTSFSLIQFFVYELIPSQACLVSAVGSTSVFFFIRL